MKQNKDISPSPKKPGDEIKELMEQKGWQQQELANLLNLSLKHVNEILNGKKNISFDLAIMLEKIFDKEAYYWIKLDTEYRIASSNKKDLGEIQTKTIIYEHMPILEMQKRGWIRNTKTIKDLEREVLNFWNIDTLNFDFLKLESQPAFRRSTVKAFNQYYTATWFKKARQISSSRTMPAYDKIELNTLLENLDIYLKDETQINAFLERLEACGVIVFILPHLKQTYINGAAFLEGNNPAIALTLRYSRLDSFWFTLLHEIGHILHHQEFLQNGFIDLENDQANKREEEADEEAARLLKTEEILSMIADYIYVSDKEIERISESLSLHPATIKGILAKKGKINYNRIHAGNISVDKVLDTKWFGEG